ncbi:hypothetical protein [Nocardioides sp.]|uniref:hypothetical protein n=1 Tax=Nocardioides sp. TaxID=35761 RepID=UPI00263A3489|nr:hypothetical protein [Nocardioides sp.]
MLTVSRRAVGGLAGLAGLVVSTAACDPLHRSSSGTTKPSADATLVAQVITQIGVAREAAAGSDMSALVAMHDAHLSLLGAAPAPSASASASTSASASASGTATGSATGSAGASGSAAATHAPATIAPVTAETQLQAQLSAAALQARSGSLARSLASMAAAVAQRVELLR